jgi:hypothetical protein
VFVTLDLHSCLCTCDIRWVQTGLSSDILKVVFCKTEGQEDIRVGEGMLFSATFLLVRDLSPQEGLIRSWLVSNFFLVVYATIYPVA